jgi:hypothetical protein
MGITGSAYLYQWCPMMNGLYSTEHTYIPMNQNLESDSAREVLEQQLYTVQSDMKQLAIRIEQAEQKIAVLTQQQADMADADMVIIRS